MQCKKCEYRLWNLTARRCPECGEPFTPSDFEFVPSSVQFCCPHCNTAYYGTGTSGHLDPIAFDCVNCGNHVHMDEMIVLPTAGIQEEQTRVEHMPWLERQQRGFFSAWFSTMGGALTSPGKLMRSLPENAKTWDAVVFAFLTTVAVTISATLPYLAIMGFAGLAGAAGGRAAAVGGLGLGILMGAVFVLVGSLLAVLISNGLWALLAHGLLRLTGETFGRLGRTYQAICYANGANIVSAVPCLGWYFGWIWWVVSAVLMVKEAQKVSGGRAAFAVLAPPVLMLLLGIAAYAAMMYFIFTSLPAAAGMANAAVGLNDTETQLVLDNLQNYAGWHDGEWPRHAVQLIDDDYLDADDFIAMSTMTTTVVTPDGVDLSSLPAMSATKRNRVIRSLIGQLPKDVVAHRVGDFVFTYHGFEAQDADDELWVVVLAPVRSMGSPPQEVTIGRVDGKVETVPWIVFRSRLDRQNRLRQTHGLEPLPDPTQVDAFWPEDPDDTSR